MDHAFLLLLRFVHVVGGALWVGGVVMLAAFVMPTQMLEGASGGRFVQRMVIDRRLSTWLSVFSGLAVLSGIVMYARADMGTGGAFRRSHAGMVFGTGGVLALLALIIGNAIGGGAAKRIGAIRAQLAAESRTATPAESDEIGRLAGRSALGTRVTAWLLLGCAAAMAVARYA